MKNLINFLNIKFELKNVVMKDKNFQKLTNVMASVKIFFHFELLSKPGRVFASVHPNLLLVPDYKYMIEFCKKLVLSRINVGNLLWEAF